MKFRTADGEFDVERFRKAVRTTITAMEIVVAPKKNPSKRWCTPKSSCIASCTSMPRPT